MVDDAPPRCLAFTPLLSSAGVSIMLATSLSLLLSVSPWLSKDRIEADDVLKGRYFLR